MAKKNSKPRYPPTFSLCSTNHMGPGSGEEWGKGERHVLALWTLLPRMRIHHRLNQPSPYWKKNPTKPKPTNQQNKNKQKTQTKPKPSHPRNRAQNTYLSGPVQNSNSYGKNCFVTYHHLFQECTLNALKRYFASF